MPNEALAQAITPLVCGNCFPESAGVTQKKGTVACLHLEGEGTHPVAQAGEGRVPTGRRVRSHTMSMFSFLATGIKKYYDIGETLGKGSFAVVKKGAPKEGGPPVAVKIVDKKDAQFDEASLQQEIAIMRKVVHPNCIRLVEVFDEKAKMYIVVELVTGGELFDRIINRGHYSEKDAANLMCEVATAIDYLHSLGIVHRDLKPENLLYSSGDEVTWTTCTQSRLARILCVCAYMHACMHACMCACIYPSTHRSIHLSIYPSISVSLSLCLSLSLCVSLSINL